MQRYPSISKILPSPSRISAVVYADGSYQMSILKSADGNGDSVQRYFFDYPQPVAGEGHFISTYKHNGNPIPSFEGEPLRFACPRTIGDFAAGLWSSLNVDNKVSLFARVIDLDTGESGDMIYNKYDSVCSDLDDPEEPELLPEELELLKKLDAEEKSLAPPAKIWRGCASASTITLCPTGRTTPLPSPRA